MGWAGERCEVHGVAFDRARGTGNVPDGEDVDRTGATVLMRPTAYLTLAARLHDPRRETLGWLGEGLRAGMPVAPAFLRVAWPRHGDAPPRVTGHEGRHRMMALRAATGDAPLPVHLFVAGRGPAFLDADRIGTLRARMADQDGLFTVLGPLFGDACVAGIRHPAPPPPPRNAWERFVPFEPGPSTEAFLLAAVTERGPGIDVDGALARLRELAVDGLHDYADWPAGRWPDAGALRRDLHGIRAGHGGDASVAGLMGLSPTPQPAR